MLHRNFTFIPTRASSCSKSVRWGGAEKIARAQKNKQQIAPIALWLKEYGKGKLLYRILTNKLFLSIHCTMYISDAVITANCFLNIISIQRGGAGAFFTVGPP